MNLRPRVLRRTRWIPFLPKGLGSQHMQPCRLCGVHTPEPDGKCSFCRVRDLFWLGLDELPVSLRGWASTNLRIWGGIIREELDKFLEVERQKKAAEDTTASKAASLAVPQGAPSERGAGEAVERPDKSWIVPKQEKDRNKSPKGSPGVEDVNLPEGEEKYSSESKVRKEEEGKKRQRSRSKRRRERSRSKRSRGRRRRSSSRKASTPEKGRRSHHSEQGKEKKAKPSVRPPKTPSRSPPRDRGGPPPKQPPVERRAGPPPPEPRPTGRYWSGQFKSWQREPQFWGVNKGRKKKEDQHYFRR